MADKRVSAALIAYGERVADERNMGTLEPGDHLPDDYFSPVRATGEISVPGWARESPPSGTARTSSGAPKRRAS
jgi:hypothetical protein